MTAPSFLVLVEEYLELRRGLGFAADGLRWHLRDFARYADRIGHTGPITVALAAAWAAGSSAGDPARTERRLRPVRAFARHRAAFDPDTEIPPAGLLGCLPRHPSPHIYTDEEIVALIRACRSLRPRDGLRPATYAAFFSLLAATGMRLSEARRLERRDVDLTAGLLTVRAGKFRKSRLVPLHPTAVEGLARYAARRDALRLVPRSDHFFRTERTPALSRDAVEKTFARLREILGWTGVGRARRPRIHDLRHTLAARSLLDAYARGHDIDRHVHALSVYLGHAKVSDTYWYLSAVPELMAVTSRRFEQFAGHEPEHTS